MKKPWKVVLLISTFTLFVFSIFILVISSRNSQILNNTLNQDLYSKYISDDDVDTEDTVVVDNPTESEEKMGELVEDTTRQILKVGKVLSAEEISQLEETYNVEFTDDQVESGVYVVNVSDDSNLEDLEDEDFVESVETDIPVKMFADTVDWGVSKIGTDEIWDYGSGSGIKVAIIDTGIQLNHPDLVANVVSGFDFVNNDETAMDDNGHGTHVSGIVAATSNGSGSVGVGYSVSLMPVKVLNSSGYGYLSDVAKGIYYAANNGARIINMSLGASVDSDTLKNAISYASRKGVLIVAAAGNEYGAPCSYPAAYSEVICVVATDKDNHLASFSNIGGELSAPGVSNYSTYLGSTYKSLSGTSMASPHVAGAAAVLMSKCTTCTTSDIRNVLRETSVDLGDVGKDIIFGYGLIDLDSAMHTYIEEDMENEEPEEEIPTETPDDTEDEIVYENQSLIIVEPVEERNNRYIHNVEEDIVLKFALSPTVESSDLSSIVVYLDNTEVYSTTKQVDEYTFALEDLTNRQYSVKVRATFNSGRVSQDRLMIDLTNIQTSSFSNNRGKNSVLGITDFLIGLFNF